MFFINFNIFEQFFFFFSFGYLYNNYLINSIFLFLFLFFYFFIIKITKLNMYSAYYYLLPFIIFIDYKNLYLNLFFLNILSINFLFFIIFILVYFSLNWFFANYNFYKLNYLYILIENIIFFIYNMCLEFLGNFGIKYFLYFLNLFLFLLFSNVSGLIFFYGASTSSFLLVFLVSCIFFGFLISKGFSKNSSKLTFIFIPRGFSKLLVNFFSYLEFIVYLFRLITLPLRLFANMFTGHILFNSFFSFVFTILNSQHWFSIFFFGAIPILFFSTIIVVVEIAAALAQTYVFLFLSMFYLSELDRI